MMQTQPFEKHVWAEIDLEALRHNFRAVKARAGALPLCAVVKADSYGHGAVQCARVFAEEGAAWLAVSCLTEAVQLRKGGLTLPILVLGHVQPGYAAALIQNHITVACYSAAQAKALSDAAVAAGGRVQIHLKADTGMGRIGFALRTDFDAAIRDMLTACALPGLEMTGLFQHFSVADDVSEDNIAYTAEQHRLFVQAFHALKAAGQEPQLVHCDNSAGVMLHPDWPEGLPRERCMARPGIILYGYDPSDEVRFGCFRPVMTLKTVVSMIKEMQPGQCASYGRRFTAEKPSPPASARTVCSRVRRSGQPGTSSVTSSTAAKSMPSITFSIPCATRSSVFSAAAAAGSSSASRKSAASRFIAARRPPSASASEKSGAPRRAASAARKAPRGRRSTARPCPGRPARRTASSARCPSP